MSCGALVIGIMIYSIVVDDGKRCTDGGEGTNTYYFKDPGPFKISSFAYSSSGAYMQ